MVASRVRIMQRLAHLLVLAVVVAGALPGGAQDKPQPGFDALGDPLPEHAVKRLGTARWRHGSRILCLSYAPIGQKLAAGGGDDPVRLWDADTGKEIRTIADTWVYGMAFTPRGAGLVTAGAHKTIRFWEVATGKEFASPKFEPQSSPIKALALSPDGTLLATGGQDGVITLWEFMVAKVSCRFKGHGDEITSLAFHQFKDPNGQLPDVTLLASGSNDRTMRFWDCETGKHLRTVDAGCAVQAVALSGDGKTAYSAGDDHLVRIWDVATGNLRGTLKGHRATVASLHALPQDRLLSGAHDGTLRVWNVGAGKETLTLPRHFGDSDALAVSRDGKFAACAGVNHTIRIYQLESGKEIFAEPGHRAPLTSLALTPGGKHLVSSSGTGEIRLWDADSGKELRPWQSPDVGEPLLACSPDGQLLGSAAGVGPIRLWDLTTGNEKLQFRGSPTDPLLSLAFVPHGGGSLRLIAGRRQGSVELWNIQERKLLHTFKYPGPAYALALSPLGVTLAVGGGSKITLFDLSARKELKSFDCKEGQPATSVASLAFAADGRTLAAGCYDSVIRLFDCATGKEIRTLEGHAHVPYAVAFSSDGRVLASGSFDRTVRLWETFSGSLIAELKGHQGPVTALAFARSDRLVYSGSADTSVLVWDTTGISKDGSLPALNLLETELKSCWLDLASENAATAQRALWKMVALGKAGSAYLESQLYLIDPAKVDQLFKDLDSDVYAIRTKASAELEKYGRWMEGRLREMHKTPPTLEVQRRIEKLLAALNVPGSLSLNQERLRVRRVMQALEQLGTAHAAALLSRLAVGAPEPALQDEARASLERLKKRG